jgi:AcrR family transcriptional regulator
MNTEVPLTNENKSRVPGRRRDPAVDRSILKTAFDLFLEQGAEGVNFEQISKRTGIARATIYRRWGSRKELLNAALQIGRTATITDIGQVLKLSPSEFVRFIENTIVSALISPIMPKLVTQLIGAFAAHAELLESYNERTLEPGWQALFKMVRNGRKLGFFGATPEPDLLRDILTGAIIHRLISRTGPPRERTERAWVKRLMRQTGLKA